jgi:CSLREA domain-containing protein
MRFPWIAIVGLAISILQVRSAVAATFNVNWPADENIPNDKHCTLREAVAAANANDFMSNDCQFQTGDPVNEDRIFVNPGNYALRSCTDTLHDDCGPLDIRDELQIASSTGKNENGKNDVIISGASVFRASSTLRMNEITVSNAIIGIFATEFIILRGCNIINNRRGIQIDLPSGGVLIENTNVSGNVTGLEVFRDAPGPVGLYRSTIDNSSEVAVRVHERAPFDCTMSTISGNHGGTPTGGVGGVFNEGGAVSFNWCTIVNNDVNVYNAKPLSAPIGRIDIRESVVADPSNGINCKTDAGVFIDLASRNLIDSDAVTCALRPAVPMVVTPTAKLGVLAFNGGFTRTHLPLPGSFVADNGSVDLPACPNDQRNVERNELATCDLGSIEATLLAFSGPLATLVANPMNATGCGPVNTSHGFTVSDLNGTPGIQCHGCVGGQYIPSDSPTSPAWADVLRLAFFGIHHDVNETRDCNSDTRRSLVADYTNIFDQACSGGACAGKPLRHLWRRSEAEDAVLADVLGTDVSKFCNVGTTIPGSHPAGFSDFLDKDPVRVACAGNGSNAGEQVCGSGVAADSYDPSKNTTSADGFPIGANLGTLGLVVAITPPSQTDVPSAELYATANCSNESLLLPASKSTFSGTCASGGPSFGGQCFTSVIRTAPPGTPLENGFNANCIQRNTTTACPFLTPSGVDCRGANLWVRRPDGTIAVDTSLSATGRKVTGGFYRIHETRSMQLISPACTATTASDQIVCLATDGDGCSAGMED